jgi:AraC-like DNA-binding protein
VLRRALRHLHRDHRIDWTQERLASEAGVSKTILCQRFRTVLGMSPIQYLRQWRLYLASAALADGEAPIIAIAEGAGYGTEAAFTRAFARLYGVPPATWRKRIRAGQSPGAA